MTTLFSAQASTHATTVDQALTAERRSAVQKPANCSNPHCVGGRVDTSPSTVDRAPWLQSDTACPVCNGTGGAS